MTRVRRKRKLWLVNERSPDVFRDVDDLEGGA
jgi:hypothetical protein